MNESPPHLPIDILNKCNSHITTNFYNSLLFYQTLPDNFFFRWKSLGLLSIGSPDFQPTFHFANGLRRLVLIKKESL